MARLQTTSLLMWLAVSNIMAGFQLKLSSWSSSVVGVSCSPLDSRHYLLSAAFTIARHTAANCHQLPCRGGVGGKISTSKEISRCRGGRACPSVDLVGFALPRIVSMSDMMHMCWPEAYLIFFNFNKQQIFQQSSWSGLPFR